MPLPAGPIYSRPRLVLIQFGNIKETSPRMCELYFKVLTKLSLVQRFTLLAQNKTQTKVGQLCCDKRGRDMCDKSMR